MKVLITGGAGFIGSNLGTSLIQRNHHVKILDDLSTGLKVNLPVEAEFTQGTILDKNLVLSILEDCDAVVHLAARGSVPRSIKDPKATHDVNATGTQIILDCAREVNCHVIFSSSSSVYGLNTTLPKDESMVLKPATPYAASKMAAEGLALSYANSYGFPVTVFRFFNVYGPKQRADHEYAAVIPKWINKCINQEVIQVFGDGTQTRDFTYIDSVTKIITDSLEIPIIHPEPINLAFGNKVSLNEVLSLLRIKFPKLEVKFEASRAGDIMHSENNPELIDSLFGTANRMNFKDCLNETVNWMVNN